MSEQDQTPPTDDGEEPGGGPAGRERPKWPGFWPWLITTVALALIAVGLWWHIETRQPQVVEVAGATPPPAEPAPELVQRARELTRQIKNRQERLADKIAALDPPRCTPPETPDLALLEKVREEQAPNIARWRSLLVPVSLAPGVRRTAPGTTASDGADTGGPASEGHSVLVPERPAGQGSLRSLSTDELRTRLETASAIVIGLRSEPTPGLVTGSGFFIGPDLLVTNRHVVDGTRAGDLYVTSGRMGRVQPVEIVAVTPPGDPGEIDFAVLRLTEGEAAGSIPVAVISDKLAPVVAAGYPSMSLGSDAGFRELLQGNLGAAPDLNMNRGEVRSIRPIGRITQIVHTADVLRGYSGGPLIDGCGRVIGVNTFIQVDPTQAGKLNNAIATSDLVAFLNQNGIPVTVDRRRCEAH